MGPTSRRAGVILSDKSRIHVPANQNYRSTDGNLNYFIFEGRATALEALCGAPSDICFWCKASQQTVLDILSSGRLSTRRFTVT